MKISDLAIECNLDCDLDCCSDCDTEYGAEIPPRRNSGVTFTKTVRNGCTMESVKILTKEASKKARKPIGEYITIICGNLRDNTPDVSRAGENFCGAGATSATLTALTAALTSVLERLIGNKKKILAVGMGNDDITYDRIGTAAAARITAVPDKLNVIRPGVSARTGINTADFIKAVAAAAKTDCVISIDSLSCGSLARLGNTIQITDTGLPRYGIDGIAVGVPTIMDISHANRRLKDNAIVISGDIEERTALLSAVIAAAIENAALHAHLL